MRIGVGFALAVGLGVWGCGSNSVAPAGGDTSTTMMGSGGGTPADGYGGNGGETTTTDGAGTRADSGRDAVDAAARTKDVETSDVVTPRDSPAAPIQDTWDSYAKGFFSGYCVSCHNDDKMGTASRDYHLLAVVTKEKMEIACGLSKSTADWTARGCTGFPPARQFPVGNGPKPSDADRDRLIRWIDANAL